MNIFVLSQLHPERQYVFLSVIQSFQEVLTHIPNTRILFPVENNPIPVLQQFNSFKGCSNPLTHSIHRTFKSWFKLSELPLLGKGPNVLLVVGLTPPFLFSAHALGPLLKMFDLRLGYLLDFFDPTSLDKNSASAIDHLFVISAELADAINTGSSGLPTSFLPLAIDTLKTNFNPANRWIDLISYGRGNLDFHKQMHHHFNESNTDRIYHHATFDYHIVFALREHMTLMTELLNRSKISICFEPSIFPRFQGSSPILYRWFEAWAAGCTIIGKKPFGKGVAELTDWKNSSIDIPDNPSDWISFVESLLDDGKTLQENSYRNYRECLMRHDWRYRLRDMFDIVGLPFPEELTAELKHLQEKVQPMKVDVNFPFPK